MMRHWFKATIKNPISMISIYCTVVLIRSPYYTFADIEVANCYVDGQPLALDDIEKDLPSYSSSILKKSKWTFMTQEDHPYLKRPWFTLHPCGTSDWMKLLFHGHMLPTKDVVVHQYLLSWLSVVGQAVGLRIPLEMLNKHLQPNFST